MHQDNFWISVQETVVININYAYKSSYYSGIPILFTPIIPIIDACLYLSIHFPFQNAPIQLASWLVELEIEDFCDIYRSSHAWFLASRDITGFPITFKKFMWKMCVSRGTLKVQYCERSVKLTCTIILLMKTLFLIYSTKGTS